MLELEISEVSKLTKLKPHTLRYYESIGLIKSIKRNESGKRVYSQQDLKWLKFIIRLRETGMNISRMKEYARLRYLGDDTISERKSIMQEHLISINEEIERLLEAKKFVENKIEVYIEMEENINGKGK